MSVGAENEPVNNGSPIPMGLPKASVLVKTPAETAKASDESDFEGAEAERNPIFDSLVKVEGDVAGLVAYSIYKQNKRAWLQDFLKTTGRPPSEAESRSYIIGESTDRRLATYRHLAAATLAGQGPEAPSAMIKPARGAPSRSASFFILWAVVLIAAVALLAYALHAGLDLNLGK
jgi:hypothetical protein